MVTVVTIKTTRPPWYRIWFLACRPHTLTASIAPCLVGHFLSSPSSIATTLSWMSFCMFIQLATNLHNDYADFIRGADTHERIGPARATQRGWCTPMETATASTLCLVMALLISLPWITTTTNNHNNNHNNNSNIIMPFIVGTSCFNAVAYTGGPYPLGYIGLGNLSLAYSGWGDIMCFLYFGLVATLVVPHLQQSTTITTTTISWEQLITALPMGFLATTILVVNNVRDRRTDIKARKRTLAVRLGHTFCQWEYTILVGASYAITLLLAQYHMCWWYLLPWATIPLAHPCLRAIWTLEGVQLNPFIGASARLQLAFAVMQCIGIVMNTARDNISYHENENYNHEEFKTIQTQI